LRAAFGAGEVCGAVLFAAEFGGPGSVQLMIFGGIDAAFGDALEGGEERGLAGLVVSVIGPRDVAAFEDQTPAGAGLGDGAV